MTVPNGLGGITPPDFGVTNDGTIPNLPARSQTVAENFYKAKVQGSPSWTASSPIFGQVVNALIGAVFDAIADAVGTIPIAGPALADIIEGFADWLLSTSNTAQTAQATAESKSKVTKGSTAPTSPAVSDMWIDTSTGSNVYKVWNGSAWVVTTDKIAIDAANDASAAQATADTAQSTATAAQATASTANSNASTAVSTANTAQTAASNAASVAAAAQETADIAYANAQYDITEFAVSTAGVILGTNEEPLGVLMTAPAGRHRIITRVIYSMKTNNDTLTVQLMRRALNGAETVVHTTGISSGAITFPDNTIDYQITDLDHYFCNVSALAGTVNTLHCALETVLVEA